MAYGFTDFMRTATGHEPYGYQAALAADGLPERLEAPSGAGKTAAAVLPWLYRRQVAATGLTPRRLVHVLPAHSLAHGTAARIAEWLRRLGLADEVGLHLIAGAAASGGAWRRRPEQTSILVGTADALLSRALMRGFADWQGMEAVSFALLHTDTQWVFDEMNLLGPARQTGVRLQQLRDELGTVAPSRTMWMSSTRTGSGLGIGLGDVDGDGALGARLNAERLVERLRPDPDRYVPELARSLVAAHVPGTRSIAVLNTPERARALYRELRATAPGRDVLLLHRGFRAEDQPAVAEGPADLIIVATPALEAGTDLSGRTLLTELAPWASMVQRAGRCNRHGEQPGAGRLLWCTPPGADDRDDRVAEWLTERQGRAVSTAEFFEASVTEPLAPTPPLRRADLLDLFDTTHEPGVAGIVPWILGPAEGDALVAWRRWEQGGPGEEEPDPGGDELCPVPLADLTELLDGRAWTRDRWDRQWRAANADDLRPGATLLLDAGLGGYRQEEGWAPDSRTPVAPCGAFAEPGSAAVARQLFACTSWVSLDQHLMETEEEVQRLTEALPGLSPAQQIAVTRAARYHDLGKCHPAFQQMLRAGGGDPPEGLLAKSKAPFSIGGNTRAHFRHELVSALILLDDERFDGAGEPDHRLVAYLAAAHHGQVRIALRRRPEEDSQLLGVRDGDRTPPVGLSTGERFAGRELSTAAFRTAGPGSWTEQALVLRDREDLGPFRLAYLETLVRVADWRSSARHDGPVPPLPAD